jgi:DMSO/TMAO reductase YedYZ heme-binding membrane subunit
MIRPILIEIGLFIAPFVIYAAILAVTAKGALQPSAWNIRRLAALGIAGFVLMLGSFVIFAQFSGAPPGSVYVPAHIENGKFVPGTTR